jgi:Uma2 family endonuclease
MLHSLAARWKPRKPVVWAGTQRRLQAASEWAKWRSRSNGRSYEAATFAEEKHFPGAPDLAVEVVSPSDSYSEVEENVLVWLRAGARLVVVVDPKKEVLFTHLPGATPEILTAEDTLDATSTVPGWAFKVGDAFAKR